MLWRCPGPRHTLAAHGTLPEVLRLTAERVQQVAKRGGRGDLPFVEADLKTIR